MKNFKILWKHTLTLMALCAMVACSSSDDDFGNATNNEDNPTESKGHEVRIGFSGEITSITDSPLSRASGAKDWYAIQVYSCPTDSSTLTYSYYASGRFDNKDDMVVYLMDGYKYMFDVTMIVDGSEKVGNWTINNKFTFSSTQCITDLYYGGLNLWSDDNYNMSQWFNRPNVDRFLGSTSDYVPTDDGTVNVEMKRVSFGVKFVPQKFTEGSLNINIDGTPTMTMKAGDTEIQDIISFNNLGCQGYPCFRTEEDAKNNPNMYPEGYCYSENIPVSIVWIKTDGTKVPIASQEITFKRNRLTTIEFTVGETGTSNSINLTSDEELQTGDTITVGGSGTGTDTNVNPTN